MANHIIGAKANIGEFDARYAEADGDSWLTVAANRFLASIQMMNLTCCEGSLTQKIEMLFRSVHDCRQMLEESWNTDLAQCPKLMENLTKIAMEADGKESEEGQSEDNNNK